MPLDAWQLQAAFNTLNPVAVYRVLNAPYAAVAKRCGMVAVMYLYFQQMVIRTLLIQRTI